MKLSDNEATLFIYQENVAGIGSRVCFGECDGKFTCDPVLIIGIFYPGEPVKVGASSKKYLVRFTSKLGDLYSAEAWLHHQGKEIVIIGPEIRLRCTKDGAF